MCEPYDEEYEYEEDDWTDEDWRDYYEDLDYENWKEVRNEEVN